MGAKGCISQVDDVIVGLCRCQWQWDDSSHGKWRDVT